MNGTTSPRAPTSPVLPASPNGHFLHFRHPSFHLESTPGSSSATIDVPFERRSLADYAPAQTPPMPCTPPLWPHRLSASFSAMADQIAAASQALALVPSTAFSGSDVSAEFSALRLRVEAIERTQERMMAEFGALKMQFTMLGVQENGVGQVKAANGGAEGEANGEGEGEGEGVTVPDAAAQAAKLEALEKKLDELVESVKLEQQRLPARLHNSRATVMKASLKPPVGANGKPPAGFPSTRGEFEHITKERYDALLKAFGQPLKGDTEAKRESLRAFVGIPQDGQ